MRLSPAELTHILANSDVTLVTDGAYTTAEPGPVAAKLVQAGIRRITLDYPPSSNRYWRVYNGVVVRSEAATAYIRHVALICSTAGIQPVDGDVVVTLRVYRPRKSGDLDNRLKVTLDALQGYAYHNDDQIVGIHATRHDNKDNPRVEVEITRLEGTK